MHQIIVWLRNNIWCFITTTNWCLRPIPLTIMSFTYADELCWFGSNVSFIALISFQCFFDHNCHPWLKFNLHFADCWIRFIYLCIRRWLFFQFWFSNLEFTMMPTFNWTENWQHPLFRFRSLKSTVPISNKFKILPTNFNQISKRMN